MYGLWHPTKSPPVSTPGELAGKRSLSHPNSPRTPSKPHTIDFLAAAQEPAVEGDGVPVVARLSRHILRLEREYQLFRSYVASADPDCRHVVKVVDLVKLPGRQGDEDRILVSIFESPGRSYLPSLIDFGRAWLTPSLRRPFAAEPMTQGGELVSLQKFFQFAIGACECLELLHHGIRVVHGEIRGDAFHFHRDTGAVRLVNFGSGVRTFEGVFSSAGWSKLSRELGVENKLQFIAPEQTGRMSVEPESRTDVYSLGVVFWVLLTRDYPFEGIKPLEIIHAVLNRRIPSISSKRDDIPEIVSHIVQKMTQKQIDDRYNSMSGLKHDLVEAERLLGEGDTDALSNFVVGSRDVSSFFRIPNERYGRVQEFQQVVDAADKLLTRGLYATQRLLKSKAVAISAASADFASLESATRSSDTSSQYTREQDEINGTNSEGPKPPMKSNNSKASTTSNITLNSIRSTSTISNCGNQRVKPKHTSRSKCHFISITGAAGMGKSSLLQDAQTYMRKKGFSAYIRFDSANKAPYEPLRRGLSSLFRQIFSESVTESDVQIGYYEQIKRSISSYWPSLSTLLDLPLDLMGNDNANASNSSLLDSSPAEGSTYSLQNKASPRPDASDYGSSTSQIVLSSPRITVPSYGSHPKVLSRADGNSSSIHSGLHKGQGVPITSEFPCGGTNTKQIKMKTIFAEVLRTLSIGKLICLCIDDLDAADDESLDLLANIVGRGLEILVIATCSHNAPIPPIMEAALSRETSVFEKVVLSPFTESNAIDLVSATMHRSKEHVAPLALACLEKTNGNPFFFKHMLETAYRKGCIWFTWKSSVWEYDLDKIFNEFKSEN